MQPYVMYTHLMLDLIFPSVVNNKAIAFNANNGVALNKVAKTREISNSRDFIPWNS